MDSTTGSMRKIGLISLGCLLAGCGTMQSAPQPYVAATLPFDEAALKARLEPGKSTITGQAFSRTVGGEVRYGAGADVFLLPITPYVEECMRITAHARSECGPNLLPYRRDATGDGEGHFKFTKLKPGRYYLEATITWGVPGFEGAIQTTGGTFRATAEIAQDGDTAEVLIH